MQIIETREAFDAFLNVTHQHPPILIPVFTDAQTHPAAGNSLCVLGVICNGETYGLPFNHSEAQNVPSAWLSELPEWVYANNATDLHYVFPHPSPTGDLQALEYVVSGSVTAGETFLPTALRQLLNKYSGQRDIHRALPLVKWMEYLQAYGTFLSGVRQTHLQTITDDPSYWFLASIGLPILHAIEQVGLHVDREAFARHFPTHLDAITKDDLVFSRYNLYSATGRPSCTWNGLNFAALNKHDGSRTAFTSRFPRGQMVLLDFESYHLRLIANLIDYQLPPTPAHEYFGQQYFRTTTLTPDQYEESKRRSFFALYSDAEATLPFFQRVAEYKANIWQTIQRQGTFPANHRMIKLDQIIDPSPAKVFNYLIQWTETERNLMALQQDVLKRFVRAQSKIVLYTYDALLIDYSLEDGPDLLRDTIALLEHFGGSAKYPVRVYHGPNYGNLTRMAL